jgi:hypothetical protein
VARLNIDDPQDRGAIKIFYAANPKCSSEILEQLKTLKGILPGMPENIRGLLPEL